MRVAIVGYTNISTGVTWQGSPQGSKPGSLGLLGCVGWGEEGRSAYQELCCVLNPQRYY